VFRFDDPFVQKIGQYPSLADIANDESRLYKMVLEAEDAAELRVSLDKIAVANAARAAKLNECCLASFSILAGPRFLPRPADHSLALGHRCGSRSPSSAISRRHPARSLLSCLARHAGRCRSSRCSRTTVKALFSARSLRRAISARCSFDHFGENRIELRKAKVHRLHPLKKQDCQKPQTGNLAKTHLAACQH
jgi:hypothetical protein